MSEVRFYPLPKVGGSVPLDGGVPARGSQRSQAAPFGDVLRREVERTRGLRFSAHALGRLAEREIQLTPADGERLAAAVERAEAKGSRDALVLLDRCALVVSVRNRTVVTAMDRQQMKENVITNIDSTVLA